MFTIVVASENLAAITAMLIQMWLHSLAHSFTGQNELARIQHMNLLMLTFVFSALILGIISLSMKEPLEADASERVTAWKRWAYASLAASVFVLVLALRPVRHG